MTHEIVQPFPDAARLDAAHARALAREWLKLRLRLWRAEVRHRRGRRGLLAATFKRPVWAAREAMGAYGTYRPAAAEQGTSSLKQLLATWWAFLRYHVPMEVGYQYAIFGHATKDDSRLYLIAGVSMPQVYRIARATSKADTGDTLADKRKFAAWCDARGLPRVATIAEFEAGALTRSYVSDAEPPRFDLFSKWAAFLGGYDTQRWRYANGEYVADGTRLRWRQLLDHLASRSRGGPVLLQPCVVNHPVIARMSPNALSTVRIMTTLRRGGAPRLLAGVLRMGTGNATADNLAQGGIAAPLDADTGVLGPARRLDALGRTEVYHHHPDSDVAIAGTAVPFWHEAVQLALRAHTLLGDIPAVGWDVAILPAGPVLVEGNWNPCIKLLQVATQTPALCTDLAACVIEWIDQPVRQNGDAWLVAAAHERPA